MATSQISITISTDDKKHAQRFKRVNGILSNSATYAFLIHRGLSCTCSSGNNRGGVGVKQRTSIGKRPPSCFGKVGQGNCITCRYGDLCINDFVEKTKKTKQNK